MVEQLPEDATQMIQIRSVKFGSLKPGQGPKPNTPRVVMMAEVDRQIEDTDLTYTERLGYHMDMREARRVLRELRKIIRQVRD